MSSYRLYIDEVGNHDLTHAELPNERFLSLTGVIIEAEHCRSSIIPGLDEMKRKFFIKDPDVPIIFHRKEIVNKLYPFQALRDIKVETEFNQLLLKRLQEWDYHVITVVIDKNAHMEKYSRWQFHPYHYCLKVLLERYVLFLHYGKNNGDVMVEGRGKKEDQKLEESYERLYERGTDKINREIWQSCITSIKLKIRDKQANICGLQVADLLAHPSRREILIEKNLIQDSRDVFGGQISEILRGSKYLRDTRNGKIDGYGKKLLP